MIHSKVHRKFFFFFKEQKKKPKKPRKCSANEEKRERSESPPSPIMNFEEAEKKVDEGNFFCLLIKNVFNLLICRCFESKRGC